MPGARATGSRVMTTSNDSSSVDTVAIYRFVPLGLIILIGAGLRFHGIAREPLWFDEAATLRCADLTLSQLWGQPCDPSPPLYYTVQKLWLLFGRSEVALRSLSAVVGTLSILITYALGRYLAGTLAGLVSAGLLATSPLHVGYSQEARGYALLAAVSMLAIWGLVRVLERSSPAEDEAASSQSWYARPGSIARSDYFGWFAYAFASICALYTHNIAALLIILSNLLLCGWWAMCLRFNRRFALHWLVANTFILAAWSWWIPVIIAQMGLGLQDFWLKRPSPIIAVHTVANVYGQLYFFVGQPYVTCAFIALGVLGMVRLFSQRLWPATLLTVISVFVPIISYVISFHTPIFMLRTISWPLPAFVILVAIGITSIRSWFLTTTAIAIAIGIQSIALTNYFDYTIRNEPWDEVVKTIQNSTDRPSAVLFCAADSEIPFSYYALRSNFLIAVRGIATPNEPAWHKLHESITHIRTIVPDQIRTFVAPFRTIWIIERLCEPIASITDKVTRDYDLIRSDWMGGLRISLFRKSS
jgi:mannosyltransferase